jgi:hypothetical protein
MTEPEQYDVVYAELLGSTESGFSIAWGVRNIGFGIFEFGLKDGKLHCSNECMSKTFIKAVMAKFVESAILEDKLDMSDQPTDK